MENNTKSRISVKTLERLIIYRKILNNLIYDGVEYIFSKKLSLHAGCSPEQVRSDLMVIGYHGSPAHGYNVAELEKSIGFFLDDPNGQKLAIIGLGKLGTSLMDYCYWRYQNLFEIVAFDISPDITNRFINGVKCYHVKDLESVIVKEGIEVAVITVPQEEAQNIADSLIKAGIKSILNYTPVLLKIPKDIFVENSDMLLSLEKLSFLSRQ